MKRKVTLVIFTILCMSALSTQAGIRIGVKGGVNLANASLSESSIQTENLTGFQIGPVVEISGLGLGVDAAILYSQSGLKIKQLQSIYEEKVSTLDVPVNLKLKFALIDMVGIYISAGPYASFRLNSESKFSDLETQWTDKKFGVGLNFGAGVELVRNLQVGVNYQLALNDDYNNFSIKDELKNLSAKTRIWSITAAYFF